MQIQISWLLQKPTDLDLHCLQNRVYPGSAEQGLTEILEGLGWVRVSPTGMITLTLYFELIFTINSFMYRKKVL